MNESINLGLGFDSQDVGKATRELKKQVKTLGAMYLAFEKMRDATEAQSRAEEKVIKQMKIMGVAAQRVFSQMGNKMKAFFSKMIPGSAMFVNGFVKLKGILGKIIGISLIPVLAPFKWLLKNGLKLWNWATDFNSRLQEIVDSAVELENRFVRFTNLFGSQKFARNINSWQHEMLQNLPILRDDLQDFTVQLRELGLDPRGANLQGVVGAALGPGNSYSQVMSALLSTAKGGDVQGLMEALGNTIDPREIMKVMSGAASQQEKFLKLLDLMNTKYGKNVENTSRIIGVNIKFINAYWNEFKESLVGTPQEGNLMWYIQQVFIDINGWIKKNKTTLMTFAKSISTVLGGVGKVIYRLFKGMTGFGAKAIGGIQSAAEKFKQWSMSARIQLEWWATRITRVFDDAADSGQGFWATMGQLWDEVFGVKEGNMLDAFWKKFKDLGKTAIDWLGEQFARVFGMHFKAAIVNMSTNESGKLNSFAPEFVRRWAKQVNAEKRFQGLKAAGVTSTQAQGSIDINNAAISGANKLSKVAYIDTKNLSKLEIVAMEEWFDRKRGKNGSDAFIRDNSINLKDFTENIKELNSVYQRLIDESKPSERTAAGLGSASVFKNFLRSKGVAIPGITSTTGGEHKKGSLHYTGGATDFQATKKSMDAFGISSENRKFGAKAIQTVFNQDGVKILYEPPKKEGLRGHFHVSSENTPDIARATESLKDKFINVTNVIHVHGDVSRKTIDGISKAASDGTRGGLHKAEGQKRVFSGNS